LPNGANAQSKNNANNESFAAKFCGIWEYAENGSSNYLKIIREKSGKFKFMTGHKYKGNIEWQQPMLKNAKAIYLRPSNGQLKGQFVSGNFYATHGQDFLYKITLQSESGNKLIYSVWSSIDGKTDTKEARLVNKL
jgi:hypothetical protein